MKSDPTDTYSISLDELDVLLADLEFDDDPGNAAVQAAASDTPVSKNSERPAAMPEPLVSGIDIPDFCKTDAAIFPEICNDPDAAPGQDFSPVSANRGGAHHRPDLAKDMLLINKLKSLRPQDFERDPRYARSAFKARIWPVGRTKASVSSKSSSKTASKSSTSEAEQGHVSGRRRKEPSMVRPPRWEDMTPELEGIWITLMMRRMLPVEYVGSGTVSELGIPCTAFSLNLGKEYEEKLRRDFIAKTGNPKREHPALTLRRRIERQLKKHLKREVMVCVVTELHPGDGRLHCHGIINALPSEACPQTTFGKDIDPNPFKAALRRAGGKWEDNCQFQVDVEPCATPGWMLYSTKQGADELEGVSASQELLRQVREKWGRYRQKIIDVQTKERAPQIQEPQ